MIILAKMSIYGSSVSYKPFKISISGPLRLHALFADWKLRDYGQVVASLLGFAALEGRRGVGHFFEARGVLEMYLGKRGEVDAVLDKVGFTFSLVSLVVELEYDRMELLVGRVGKKALCDQFIISNVQTPSRVYQLHESGNSATLSFSHPKLNLSHPQPQPPTFHNNKIIMAHNFQANKVVNQIEKKMIKDALMKSEQQKKIEIFQYDNYDSEFMHPMNDQSGGNNANSPMPKINKSMVLGIKEAERSLNEIYSYYLKAYDQPKQQHSDFAKSTHQGINIKSFLLFAKDFKLLKTIFSLERLTIIFKKHADYGKYLSFDNFYFTINSISHEAEVKAYFHLQSMLQNLDAQTIEELEKQEFYNYLQLGTPEKFRRNFTELFGAFNTKEHPRTLPLRYDYRKFSLPELRRKALPEHREKKRGEKDLFIIKHDKETSHNIFDEAKSIVVSWDSLRAKSVNNLGKPADLVQRKYLKADPEEDPYLQEMRPSSRLHAKSKQQKRNSRKHNAIELRIKEIEQNESIKNQQILNRIQKKLHLPSARKLQL